MAKRAAGEGIFASKKQRGRRMRCNLLELSLDIMKSRFRRSCVPLSAQRMLDTQNLRDLELHAERVHEPVFFPNMLGFVL